VADSIGPIRPLGDSNSAKIREAHGTGFAKKSRDVQEIAKPASINHANLATEKNATPATISSNPTVTHAALVTAVMTSNIRNRTLNIENSSDGSGRVLESSPEGVLTKSARNSFFGLGKVNAVPGREQRRRRLRNAFEFAFNRLTAEEDMLGLPIDRPNFFSHSKIDRAETELALIVRRLLGQYQALIEMENLVDTKVLVTAGDFIDWVCDIFEAFKESVDFISLELSEKQATGGQSIPDWLEPVATALNDVLLIVGQTSKNGISERASRQRFKSRFEAILRGTESQGQLRNRAKRCEAWVQLLVAMSQIRMLIASTSMTESDPRAT
jgi:hypothetical protein